MKILIFTIAAGISAFLFWACNNKNATSSDGFYQGNDISNEAEITRDNQTRQTTLHVNTNGKWKIYAGNDVETINYAQPVREGEGKGSFELQVPANQRNYFQFVTDNGKAILAERHLPMQGGYNFRDLGGLKTDDDRFVKWGKIFRSDDLHGLTDEDLAYLASIPIKSVVDFRSDTEINDAPDKIPGSSSYYPYTITPGNLPTSADMSSDGLAMLQSMDMDSLMRNINELLVTDSSSIRRYNEYFRLLEDETKVPLLFHCSAGKDRTGMAAALTLFALGVDEDTVYDDYLLSNKFIKDKYAPYTAQYPSLEPLFSVKKEYLEAGIKKMKDQYGSVENFLDNILHVDRDKLKVMYLY